MKLIQVKFLIMRVSRFRIEAFSYLAKRQPLLLAHLAFLLTGSL